MIRPYTRPTKMGSMTSHNKICHHCIREPFLQREVSTRGSDSDCSFCCRRARAYDLALLADRVEAVFEQYYQAHAHRAPPRRNGPGSTRPAWNGGGVVFPSSMPSPKPAGIPRDAAVDIQCLLDARHGDADARRAGLETEFCSDAHYEERAGDGNHWHQRWMQFETAMKTEARFFGHRAKEVLTQVFAGIDNIDDISGGLQPLVADIGPDAHVKFLYRARVFQSENSLRDALSRPHLELGPPPTAIASAGRMNARGISVFYGATHAEVAIAEVRPPVGSLVAVARFEILRPLRVLSLGDLHTANAEGSIFDHDYTATHQRAAFLRTLSRMLCRPVLPAAQDLDYIPTQAVADFLATENDPPLDGVAYPTTQIVSSEQNVVLFHKAARVATPDLPPGALLEATGPIADGVYTGYLIRQSAPRSRPVGEPVLERGAHRETTQQPDVRQPTLRVRLDSTKVHKVTHVALSTDVHPVAWHP